MLLSGGGGWQSEATCRTVDLSTNIENTDHYENAAVRRILFYSSWRLGKRELHLHAMCLVDLLSSRETLNTTKQSLCSNYYSYPMNKHLRP